MDKEKLRVARTLALDLRCCVEYGPVNCDNCTHALCTKDRLTDCCDQLKRDAAKMLDDMATEQGQEAAPPNTTAKMELLHTLCGAVSQHQNPWDVGIMDQLLAAWDACAVIADPLTVALLAPKLEWAEKCLKGDPYLADELYARLLLAVIPAICPALDENEEEAEPNDGKD